MSDIDDLPFQPTPNQTNQTEELTASSLDTLTMNELMNSLQSAKLSGATKLPMRDVPMTTQPLATDAHVQVDYIPPAPKHTPIQRQKQIQRQDEQSLQKLYDMDYWYEELRIPLFIGILFFLFQLPSIRKYVSNNSLISWLTEGNGSHFTTQGIIVLSFVYSVIYYMLMKVINR